MANMYRRGVTGAWDAIGGWSDTEGGASNGLVPDNTTDVFFGAASSGFTCTVQGGADTCKSILVTGTPTITSSGENVLFVLNGNVTFANATITNLNLQLSSTAGGNCNYSGSGLIRKLEFTGTSGSTITTSGTVVYVHTCTINTVQVTLNGAFSCLTNSSIFTVNSGHLITSGVSLSVGTFSTGAGGGRTLNFSGSSVNFLGSSFSIGSGWTFTAPSTILVTGGAAQIFDPSGYTWNTLVNSRSVGAGGTFTISGSTTFTNLNVTNSGATTYCTAGITLNIGAMSANGGIFRSTSAAVYTWNNTSGSTINVPNINIQYCTGTGTGLWSSTGSWTDAGNNTGWTFIASANNSNRFFFLF